MATETWAETVRNGATPDPDAETLDPLGIASGRLTVLPRLEADGESPRLVSDSRRRFDVGRELGRGGLGEVHAATDHDIGRQVAIKRIRPDRESHGAFLRFVQEVRTVGRLDHPGIVPVHDVGRDEHGHFYFVMKFVEGETLAQLITKLRSGDAAAHVEWPFERRVTVFHRLLYAVCHAHERGVVHRDIKPDNVMIGPHGQVQLLDWGIAHRHDAPELDPAGAVVGTPRYMAPEQARGERADERADTWALSLLLYEWLTLHHPAEGTDSTPAILQRMGQLDLGHPRTLPVHPAQGPVPADLGWYVADGLRVAIDTRYPTVQAMLDRLDRRANGDIPVQCPMTMQKSWLMRSQRLLDRHPLGFTAAVVVACTGTMLGLGGLATVVALALTG